MNDLEKENENLLDTIIDLKLTLKNKDKIIHDLIVKNNEMQKDIYDLTEITKNYDAISVTDTDDFKVCIFSAKYFEKGFVKKNLISKGKLRKKKEEYKKHCNECGFTHLNICEHCFYRDRINLINEIIEDGDDKNE